MQSDIVPVCFVEVVMCSFESLAVRLASDQAFRARFVDDPWAFYQQLSAKEQQTLERLRPLLTCSTHDLLTTLLGQVDSKVGVPWDWGSPFPLTPTRDG